MIRRSDNILMIAARVPAAGATKTRLGQAIGMDRAARLYAAFLCDLAGKLTPELHASDVAYDLAWTHSPPHADFRSVLRQAMGRAPEQIHYVPQIEDVDWGARQQALLRWGHEHGYRRTVLIASDSPQLERATVVAAFEALHTSAVVIGRVHDGGYFLIGQRGCTEILADVRMSTASAADGVIERARSMGLAVAEVPATFDVDVVDDLDHLRTCLLACQGRLAPATWQAMKELGLR